jgi:hypothetical protein
VTLGHADNLIRVDALEAFGRSLSDNRFVMWADRLPVGEAVIAAKPGDGRHAGHPCNMKPSGIAAEVEAAGLHDGGKFQEVEFTAENAPW